jgi:hypothetical protein
VEALSRQKPVLMNACSMIGNADLTGNKKQFMAHGHCAKGRIAEAGWTLLRYAASNSHDGVRCSASEEMPCRRTSI